MALVPPPPAPAAVLKAHTAYPDLCGAFRATACWCSQPAACSSGADWGQSRTEVCVSSACCAGRSWRSTSSPGSSSAAAERSRSASGTTGSPTHSSGRSQARLFSHNFKVKDTTSRSSKDTTSSLATHNRSLELIDTTHSLLIHNRSLPHTSGNFKVKDTTSRSRTQLATSRSRTQLQG